MKTKRLFSTLLISLLIFIVNISNANDCCLVKSDCFSIVVGKDASIDGSVLFAHNEDDDGHLIVNYYIVPVITHPPEEYIMLKNGGQVPQVKETYRYLWFQMPGMDFSDSYFNEYGVCVASDKCLSKEEQGELSNGGISYWLRRLIAERANSAREGVKIAGKLIEEYGYNSSGRTYIIADPNEAWMLSVVFGKHWVAQRVPDDKAAVIPNYFTIGEIDLSDTLNFLGSKDIINYAFERGWYNPEEDGSFNFAKAYSSLESRQAEGNIHRMWRGLNLLAKEEYNITDEFPFAFEPKKKLSVQDLIEVLRDHYEGTELDKSLNYELGSPYELNGSTICAVHNQYGFVAQLRNWLPNNIGTVIWLSQRRPDSQPFIPWYFGLNKIPKDYNEFKDYKEALSHHFQFYIRNGIHAYYTFDDLAEKVQTSYSEAIFDIKDRWSELEKVLFKNQESFEKEVMNESDKEKRQELITNYTKDLAEEIIQISRTMLDKEKLRIEY